MQVHAEFSWWKVVQARMNTSIVLLYICGGMFLHFTWSAMSDQFSLYAFRGRPSNWTPFHSCSAASRRGGCFPRVPELAPSWRIYSKPDTRTSAFHQLPSFESSTNQISATQTYCQFDVMPQMKQHTGVPIKRIGKSKNYNFLNCSIHGSKS